MNRRSRPTLALLALTLLVASPALPQSSRSAAPPVTTSFGEAVRGLVPDFLNKLVEKAGCVVDPFGAACQPNATVQAAPPSPRAVSVKAGCVADPLGAACHPATTSQTVTAPGGADAGCSFDPLGGCLQH